MVATTHSYLQPAAVYRCETWSLNLREQRQYRLKVFEKKKGAEEI